MTPRTPDRCRGCPSSVDGCWARERAGAGRCCSRCSHRDPDPDGGVKITRITRKSLDPCTDRAERTPR